ncbi:hypothetical protein [Cohnella sp. 56]|uniref:hypothetical protein n=1 Tax=Cohnella sp. 56 TaxID=3113722 RepID=UPI0030E7AB37
MYSVYTAAACLRELRKKKALIWFGVFFFGIGAVVAISSGEWLMSILAAGMTIAAIFARSSSNRGIPASPQTITRTWAPEYNATIEDREIQVLRIRRDG